MTIRLNLIALACAPLLWGSQATWAQDYTVRLGYSQVQPNSSATDATGPSCCNRSRA